MKIIPLSEGAFTVDKTKKFVPFSKNDDDLQERPTGSLLVEIQPFVVLTRRDVLLIDTGLGFFNTDGTAQIHQNMLDAGINPMDVTRVLLSHLHKDHSGGISREDKVQNRKFLNFPKATYYVQQQELDFALEKGAPSFTPQEFEILKESDQVVFLQGNGVLDDYIHYEITGAHSPFHQLFRIVEDGETVFFGGDVAPQLQQMKNKFIAKYDFDGRKCMELRQQWWEQGQQEGWTFLFYHDIASPVHSFR